MPRDRIEIEVKKDNNKFRAKHSRLIVNGKRIDYPLKATGISANNQDETTIAKNEVKRTIVNEISVQINPLRLRQLMTNDSEHQSLKDSIRNVLGDVGDNAINMVYPLLLNYKSPNETDAAFRPFPTPNQKIAERLFDLFDIDGLDIIVSPVALDDANEAQWARICAPIFASRHTDYLNEYALSGLVPNGLSQATAIQIARTYLDNGYESLTFDFHGNRVREVLMKGIIESLPNWDKLLIHGVNVPHYDWHRTHKNPVQPTYDVLVSVYGFDSFGNLRFGFDSKPDPKDKIEKKITRKRYHFMDTYGAYNKEGLKKMMETTTIKCRCPVCSGKSSPLELFDRPSTNEALDAIADDLKRHRLHVTHMETSKLSNLIDNSKYHDYLKGKKAAAKEIQSIVNAISRDKKWPI